MWEQGNNPIEPIEDVTAKFDLIEDEMPLEEAQAQVAEFFYHNPGVLFDWIADIKLYPFQEIIIKGWARNDYNMAVWGRGLGKSFLVALFAIYWALFNKNNRVVIVSFAFRASRRILEQCEKFIIDEKATLLKACFPKEMEKKPDEWKWRLPNGSTIQCLPLGDGTKIRGIRADTLIVDEFAYLPETVIAEILQPFLVASNNVKDKIKIKAEEDEMIARGEMKEEDRTIVKDTLKVVFLSSACYKFEHMYKKYCEWVENIVRKNTEGTSYFVSRFGHEATPAGLVNEKVIAEARASTSQAIFDREYRAIFTDDSDGYFSAKKMLMCTIPDGESPNLELYGEKGEEYVLGIDPSSSNAESSDDFAMTLLKIIPKKDGKKVGMLVHSYAVAGGNLKDHTLYLFYLLKNFNIVYIIIDSSQGNNNEFINSSNQSKLFKENKIELIDIDAEFSSDDIASLPKQIKRSYNKGIGRIVQKQKFTPPFLRSSNEYLQGCFDYKNIFFAGKIAPCSTATQQAMNADFSLIREHTDFADMSTTDIIERQDELVDLTKKECALVEVKNTTMGSLSWDLPRNLKQTGGANKVRKDSYSSLLMANWGLKLYLEAQSTEVQNMMPDFDFKFVA